MKFNEDLLSFYDYFCQYLISDSDAVLPSIGEEHWEELYRNKLLYPWLEFCVNKYTLSPWAKKRLDIYRKKNLLHAKLLSKLEQKCESDALISLKGESFKHYYPQGFQRESRDVDILYKNEKNFIDAHDYLLSLGFKEMFVWMRKTNNRISSSAKFRLRNNEGDRALDDIYVEIHFNSFPVSNFSNLHFDELFSLTEVTRLVVLLIAEFTFRDGVTKKFTLRDMIDVKLTFNLIRQDEWSSLSKLLKQARLEAPLLLLADFWQQEIHESMPPLLAWLNEQYRAVRWYGNYSIIEHQSWPYQQQSGMTRPEFDEIVQLHGLLYDSPRQTKKNYSNEEMALWMEKGMPVVAKYQPTNAGFTLLERYRICDRFIY
ncbi:nucleotidyltransferase family protein [Pantoea eucalypti]|jgi:hypothetical protein|uniref:nucleotidyltransferase family protein n=1 Tax=Pantoea eucalypti TaxID=470933 RepID=UPI003FA41FCA